MSETETITDVVELCALLQCLGFTVKSLDTSDVNLSQDGGTTRTIVVNCQSSGLHVVLESPAVACSCPVAEQNSGFWQVSGIAGGKHHEKESGSSFLRSIPKSYRLQMSKDLLEMIRNLRALNDSNVDPKPINKSASMVETNKSSLVELSKEGNKSTSLLELATPEEKYLQVKVETPTRFRSLDALTSTKEGEPLLSLQTQYTVAASDDPTKKATMYRRQRTYTVTSTPPNSARRRNKTSSPIQSLPYNLVDNLMEAEKAAESVRAKLNSIIHELMEDKHDSSISSMLDVSKISVLKATETSKAQFASSPNLSRTGSFRDELKSRLKRFESASTSNLVTPTLENKSKLNKISPSLFKSKKENATKDNIGSKDKFDGKSKLQSLFRPKIVTPIRTNKPVEASPNLSSINKKKFSHIKSTIPRPTSRKD